ncbi:sugar ABC transporter ATP-binding protein [Acidisoma cellulosilytica]|uniref:Sugar ABC transporter ATP-binding protein n=1 Tax=Acidisoma cellulosilyticum TaxID=2802395 RepID=A0A963Z791_9PROT|nr:sugar ABC transporter ATP-binding protein [Acidisoma cellulosilyticum]MCB8884125.1 sugar ABC transporter ATP-binding protein [Acidisoma cellulosilyticum]
MDAPAPLALRLSNLSKTFGGQKALDQVALDVAQGEVHGLLGQNGSGKSTLIKVLAGFHPPDAGSLLQVCGVDVPLPLAAGAFRLHRMSFVHQHLGLIPGLTALENLLINRLARRHAWAINWRAEHRKAIRQFESYGVPIDPGALVSDLPPVERALLAIVRAAGELSAGDGAGNGLLILDEPTPFLPKRDVEQLFRLVRSIVATGASAIFVSHDVDEVMEITDRATILRDGRVAAKLDSKTATKRDFVQAIVGRQLLATTPPRLAEAQAPSHIVIQGLCGGSIVDLSLAAGRSEVIGLTGLIGSGYDEVCYLLYGAKRATQGQLAIGKRHVALPAISPKLAIEQGIVLIPGDRATAGVIDVLPVSDNVTMPVLGSRFRPWMLDRRAMVRRAGSLGETFEVRPANPTLPMSALSGGNQQKVVLAKWFQQKPVMILLDEPTQGVDIGARQNVFSHIAKAALEGATVLCASSDYEQLAAICSRVLIFSGGRVVASLAGAEISKDAIAERCLFSAAPVTAEGNMADVA